jgi:hypothetical protein
VLSAFGPHPLEGAEVFGRHANEAVVFEDVADFDFTQQMGPDVRHHPPKPGGPPSGLGTITASRPPARRTYSVTMIETPPSRRPPS